MSIVSVATRLAIPTRVAACRVLICSRSARRVETTVASAPVSIMKWYGP
jgi:hypothetical protein